MALYKIYDVLKFVLKFSTSKFRKFLAFVLASIAYKGISWFIDQILCGIFKMESLNVVDEMFLYDDE